MYGKVILTLVFLGCANQPCREPVAPAHAEAVKPSSSRIWVARSNEGKQCEDKGISVEVMEKQLKGVRVLNRKSESDGKMRIQMCGASTGIFNVYEIESADLEKAKKLGFEEWKKQP